MPRYVDLVCTGRAWEPRRAVPTATSRVCGRRLERMPRESVARFEARARVVGWRLGPVGEQRCVMCPRCAPQPEAEAGAVPASAYLHQSTALFPAPR